MSEKKQNPKPAQAPQDERESRLRKLNNLKEAGINPYPNRFTPKDFSVDIKKKFEENGEKEFTVTIAGRIILHRSFGKAAFSTIKDSKGTIQIYTKRDVLGEEPYKIFKNVDIGDIIGVSGRVFRTQKGEITVEVSEFTLLSKAMQGLPEKFHGLTDVETRYRERYVDLIVNDDVRHDFTVRSLVIANIRSILHQKGFMEVETPILQIIPGGASARPFVTHHNALDTDMYLRIAPELYLKRLIVGGFDRVFEMNRNFRNEGIDTSHNPEFTMLELYQAYGDYQTMMDIFEEIMASSAKLVKGSTKFTYQGKEVDFGNWKKIKYVDALKEIGGVDVSGVKTREEAVKLAESKGYKDLDDHLGKWGIINLMFEDYVEERLMEPTIVYEYPSEISPLAKNCPDNPEFVERFEPFCMTRELGNAFSELNDPFIQAEKFQAQADKKGQGDDEAMYFDADYINALEHAMPPTGGLGIGIDRLIMFLVDTNSIRDTILFPTLKPRD